MLPKDVPFCDHAYGILTDAEWELYARAFNFVEDVSRTFEDADIPDTFELPLT